MLCFGLWSSAKCKDVELSKSCMNDGGKEWHSHMLSLVPSLIIYVCLVKHSNIIEWWYQTTHSLPLTALTYIFCGHFKFAGQTILCIFAWFLAKIPISDSQMKTLFNSQIQSFDDRRLIFWILGINTPISYCVKKNWSQGAPSLKT